MFWVERLKVPRKEQNCVCITRACVTCGLKVVVVVIELQPDENKSRQRDSKLVAPNDLATNASGFQPKKHLVLGDVTNIHAPIINCLPIVEHIMPTS
jgi:hypothetical protein